MAYPPKSTILETYWIEFLQHVKANNIEQLRLSEEYAKDNPNAIRYPELLYPTEQHFWTWFADNKLDDIDNNWRPRMVPELGNG